VPKAPQIRTALAAEVMFLDSRGSYTVPEAIRLRKLIIAVGSTRRPKLDGVRYAFAEFGSRLDPDAQFDIFGVEVPSGVRDTPLSRAEMMQGARNRAEHLQRIAKERNELWNYFIGLEGGLEIVNDGTTRLVFLENWAYVLDSAGRGSFGQSGAVAVPEPLAAKVVDEGADLAEAVDAFAGAHGIRDAQGAWGVLTRDLITRRDAFLLAVINAFAPFYNVAAYREDATRKAQAK
jgi:inosine/xanthosine triphosphatase